MESSNDQTTQDYIKRESERFSTANTYRLDNPYLTIAEKEEVELWFQLPETILFISICIGMIYSTLVSPLSLKLIIGTSVLADVVAGLMNWSIPAAKARQLFFLTGGHNVVLWALALTTAGILAYHELYLYAGIVLVGKFGLFMIISPSMYLYTILSKKYGLHAKWAYFKKFHSRKFPFEKEVQAPQR